MIKSVLLSIRPEWADKILTGEKTMEVRKTRPRLETPFKCYIYATKCRDQIGWLRLRPGHGWQRIDGMVIAEFTCDEIRKVNIPCPEYQDNLDALFIRESCMSYYALHNYCPEEDVYFWHISDLEVYDEPKNLYDFSRYGFQGLCGTDICGNESCKYYNLAVSWMEPPECELNGPCRFIRPPQSWCYAEKNLEED